MITTLNVQFSDASQDVIVSYFSGPQTNTTLHNVGTVTDDDPRWATFYMGVSASGLPAPTTA